MAKKKRRRMMSRRARFNRRLTEAQQIMDERPELVFGDPAVYKRTIAIGNWMNEIKDDVIQDLFDQLEEELADLDFEGKRINIDIVIAEIDP